MKNENMKKRLQKRNEKIRTEFLALKEKKSDGVQIYTDDYILQKLADKYFLAAKTIENIVFNRVKL
jgi:rRNA maturation endonuclease Nob1